ncbi:MAG: glutamine--tRNA ligase/YqeY domain fusion protein [Candidatus Thiodiazotropha sp. (ex Lucinoma aequizonata)]|nr:glutamine--tRNA ligase/YqeY domain fusion protein [Candidatus Thiodiazotropha sp. (ex Lucinoma aequizonata)]MCU7888611.1 glutamine--tRNA ligase/YqeY domain fusion protein [Candidatus Thiodiazotropha sp. (ex Lucinoma aequizonata)]MCU7895810.1 glutamine--tRNA ligase/YqeY domain fusion protein [Candidatus Thiodiazotropha sp. (ex Lucinoma aequizonata)]MCU7900114.1 glutamine--tRNA ligase/YqeY domain fusion protein [Candidatus Thiodiazotropha sp. (ex Lucinoma aequizonata)]MCU7903339.1 glutamine--t
MSETENTTTTNFIRQIVEQDLKAGKNDGHVHTRFPPEPNGYLHIGHAKSIVLNFGIANDYKGQCNLRFDDTNPHKENIEFVDSIQQDVRWLGCDWQDRLFYASNYFQQLHDFAVELIQAGKAYVCDLDGEQMRAYRGTLKEPGQESPYRSRSVDENLDLFARMKASEFPDGERVLRAKIDMGSPNMNLRDPTLYRIRHGVIHHQTGEAWCIYPMYDYTHPVSDALEGITHSLCTLEFEDHRPLYDWVLDNISIPCHPQQIEFSRLNLEYTVLSKRKLTQLVDEGFVEGWDDPRIPTVAGMRRRGYSVASIREFCLRIGITKSDGLVEMGMLESCIREELDAHSPRRMAVMHPLKVVIENYPQGQSESLTALNHPKDEAMGKRQIDFCREVYIDQADFREQANKKYKRLMTGGEVRLRNAYVIKCEEVMKNNQGEIVELRCSYDPETLGKNPQGRKVRGVVHWVSAQHGVKGGVRLYDRLFNQANADKVEEGGRFTDNLNPDSLQTLTDCYFEPSLAEAGVGEQYQFEREGYFILDSCEAAREELVFNRIITLRDSWAKINKAGD